MCHTAGYDGIDGAVKRQQSACILNAKSKSKKTLDTQELQISIASLSCSCHESWPSTSNRTKNKDTIAPDGIKEWRCFVERERIFLDATQVVILMFQTFTSFSGSVTNEVCQKYF